MKNEVRYKYPLWISWEITNECNYNCIHCRMDAKEQKHFELSTKEIKKVIDEFQKLGIYRINYSGGEPFIRKDFIEILRYTSEKNIDIGITTNGFFINEEIANQLLKIKNLKVVQISLDGPNETVHNYIRNNPESFKRAIEAIKILRQKGITTGVVTTVMKINVSLVSKIVELINDLDVKVYGARRFIPVGEGERRCEELLPTKKQYQNHLELWSKLENQYKTMQFTIEEPLLALIDGKRHLCQGGNSYGAITANGDVRPCIFLPIEFGNLKKDTFEKCWTKLKNNFLLEQQNSNGFCSQCEKSDLCNGCRAMAHATTGSTIGEDIHCFFKSIDK